LLFFPDFYFNVDNGYLKGLVCSLKAGVLSQADYFNLVQLEIPHPGTSRGSCRGHIAV
uniref:Uncharacterized protein n=1 Tax=Peromyscus maniculatus bairdii TaxID=230844 RepID=A0A8C8W2F0_PERMB